MLFENNKQLYILYPGSYKISQAVYTCAPLIQHNIGKILTFFYVHEWST